MLAVHLAVVLTGSAAAQTGRQAGVAGDCARQAGERHSVVRVLDGETLALDGGGEVRLIGALAPRAWDAVADGEDWPLADTSKSELEAWIEGRSVELVFAGRRTDRYGHLLAQVYLSDPAGTSVDGKSTAGTSTTGKPIAGAVRSGAPPADASPDNSPTWVQGWLLRRGLARAYGLEGHFGCLTGLLRQEQVAREGRVGLWAIPAYAVRQSSEPEALLQRRGTFQVVEGEVRAVSDLRSVVYINFGDDVRQDFTISIRGDTRRRLHATQFDPQQFAQRRVRVRGWIERRGGPLIDIHDLAEIEVVDPVR